MRFVAVVLLMLRGVFWIALTVLVLFGGGLLALLLRDVGPHQPALLWEHAAILAGAFVTAVASGVVLHRRQGRALWVSTVATGMMALFTLVLCNVAASVVVPPRPARGLHGVRPAVDGGVNSWGQRDEARAPAPPGGKRRIALVGDSFLEEGSTIPVGSVTQSLLGDAPLELVNLGVSATSPDEYFYRTRNIAIPLGAQHVVLFFYAGNDLMPHRTLHTWFGVMATWPRDSLLSVLGLNALAHVGMNRHRPILAAWGAAGEVAAQEKALAKELADASDAALLDRLVRHVPAEKQPALRAHLMRPEMASVVNMLHNPDGGNFRSYYLWAALELAAGVTKVNPVDETFPRGWVMRTAQLCKAEGLDFTLVLVPEAFSVDDRMREQWLPLADLRAWSSEKTAATLRIGQHAKEAGVDVLDLHPVLQGTRGTYLNLDGHWSADGVSRVASALAAHLRATPP